ncbi:MAG: SRPBCC family protein [Isosphaeraceae bacterium]
MKPVVIVEIEICSSAERIFQAWIDPEILCHWMFSPAVRDESIIHLNCDARPGGRFSFLVNRNQMLIDHVGEYQIVNKPTELQFTWAIGQITGNDSKVRVEIRQISEHCRLTIRHEMQPDWADYIDRTRQGWEKMARSLKVFLESIN